MAQNVVLLPFIAEIVGVETDILENIPQLGAVCLFDGMQHLVDAFPIASLVTAGIQIVESCPYGQHECFLLHQSIHQLRGPPDVRSRTGHGGPSTRR